jgi:hypothetical protein
MPCQIKRGWYGDNAANKIKTSYEESG